MIKEILKVLSPKYQVLFPEYKVDFKPRYGHGKPPHAGLYERINGNRSSYGELLKGFLDHKEALHKIQVSGKEKDPKQPCWNNGFLPGLDIISLYGLLAVWKPKQYVEIGSGNSTKVARKAISDHGLNTKIISIDPFPRVEIDQLADEVIRQPLENLSDLSFADKLEAGDILYIDNSHRCFPNSDVTVCFLEVIPRLKPGVIVHIHDIYLPYDYPQFMADRFYSEQYLLACWLLASETRFEVILPNYFVSEDKELSSILAPIWDHPNLKGVERHGGSFWLRIGA